jgi:hypothetical protein
VLPPAAMPQSWKVEPSRRDNAACVSSAIAEKV